MANLRKKHNPPKLLIIASGTIIKLAISASGGPKLKVELIGDRANHNKIIPHLIPHSRFWKILKKPISKNKILARNIVLPLLDIRKAPEKCSPQCSIEDKE